MKLILLSLFSFIIVNSFSQGDTTYFKENKKIIIEYKNHTKIIKYKRKWMQERTCMLYTNLTRLVLFHQPLIGIGTFRMHRGARQHSVDMAKHKFCNHKNFNNRSDEFHFRGENVASGFRTGFGFYWGWLNSSGHRKNMLSWRYFFTGIAIQKKIQIDIYYKKGKRRKKERKVNTYGTHVFR